MLLPIRTESLAEYYEELSKTRKARKKFAHLYQVLIKLVNLNVRDENESHLKYSSIHLISCSTLEKPGLAALVYYNSTSNNLEANSFVVDFVEAEKINWKEIGQYKSCFFWVNL